MFNSVEQSFEHRGRLSMSSIKLPHLSMSEIKSPTMNSSFFKKGILSPPNLNITQLVSPQQSERIKLNAVSLLCSKFKLFTSQQKEGQQKMKNKFVEFFVQKLKQKAYIYSDQSLNSIQKTLLTEKYLEISYTDNKSNWGPLIYFIVFEAFSPLCIFILLFWIPLEVGFQLNQSQILQGLNILIVGIDLSKSFFPIKVNHQSYDTLIDLAYLVAYLILEFSNNKGFLIFTLNLWLFLSLKQLKIKLNKWIGYIPFDIKDFDWFIVVIALIHYCSCIWHFIGISTADSWITDFYDDDNYTQYCYSLYWSIATLMGIGQFSIKITTTEELLYTALIMFISVYLCAFIFVKVYHITNKNQQENKKISILFKKANEFLKDKGISYKLKCQVRNELKQKQTLDQNEVLVKLSPSLRMEVLLSLRQNLLQKCRTLTQFSKNTINKLTQQMEQIHYNNENIQTDIALYIIEEGVIEVLAFNKVVALLKRGDSFDEYSFLSDNISKTEFRSVGAAVLYKITRDEFIKVIKETQLDYERYLFIKHSLQQEDYSPLNLQCYSCFSQHHLISDCPIINYKPSNLFENQNFQIRCKQKRRFKCLNNVQRNLESLKQFRKSNNYQSFANISQIISSEDESFSESNKIILKDEESQDLVKNLFVNLHEGAPQKQRKSRVSVMQPNQKKSSLSQIKRLSLQDFGGEKLNQQTKQVTFKIKPNKVADDDNGTLNLSDDQISPPFTKQSHRTANYQNQSIVQIFPSQLSLIPNKKPLLNDLKPTFSPGFLDLSVYQNNLSKYLEFDRMHQYTIYFPNQNSEIIIRLINYIQRKKQRGLIQIKQKHQ